MRLRHLGADRAEPGRAAEGQLGLGRLVEVERPLEAVELAGMGAGRVPFVLQRQAAQAPGGFHLSPRIGDGIVLAELLRHPRRQGLDRVEAGREPVQLDFAEIHRRVAVLDAMGQRHAGPAAGGDAD